MYISKKKRMILLTAVPAFVVVSTVSILAPIVVAQENKTYETIDSAKNIMPETATQSEINEYILKGELKYNPRDFSKAFFVENIANQKIVVIDENNKQTIINSNSLLFKLPNKELNNKVNYEVVEVYFDSENQLIAKINKEYNGKSKNYIEKVDIKTDFFNDSLTQEQEQNNFLNYASDEFRNLVRNENITITSNVSDIESLSSQNLFLNGKNGIYFDKKTNNIYTTNSSNNFILNKSDLVSFSFVVDDFDGGKTAWKGSDAWPLNDKNEFDKDKSKAYKYLKENESKFHLPELTNDEKEGLSDEQIKQKQLQKFLFDPNKDPYIVSGNTRIPDPAYYAIIVKLSLGSQEKYALVWQNVSQSAQTNIVSNAAELKYQTKKQDDNSWPSADDIIKNYDLVEPVSSYSNNLSYKVLSIKIPTENNPNNDIVDLVVEIRSTQDEKLSKQYSTRIEKGIKSKQQITLDETINNLIGNGDDISKIIPTATVNNTEGKFKNIDELILELNKLIKNNDIESFNKIISLSYKNGTSGKIDYVPVFVNKLYVNNKYKLIITYQLVSPENHNAISAVVSSIDVEIDFNGGS